MTLSTLWWEEESLTPLNMVGIAVCVSGIALHVAIKAYYSRGDSLVFSCRGCNWHHFINPRRVGWPRVIVAGLSVSVF